MRSPAAVLKYVWFHPFICSSHVGRFLVPARGQGPPGRGDAVCHINAPGSMVLPWQRLGSSREAECRPQNHEL